MHLNSSINLLPIIGLVFDIIGVLLLFEFGLPSKIQRTAVLLDVGDNDSERLNNIHRRNKKILFWSYFGLAMVGIGFVLQMLGSIFTLPVNITCK